MLPCDPGCHGVNFGTKQGSGYYAYVASKFSGWLIIVDAGLSHPANSSTAGRILLIADKSAPTDDGVTGLPAWEDRGLMRS
ncbi:MAG: hypothetical protein LZF61_03680 [Nitrosomonas sp.]|nr:MAG: hypothetical protein LZF61_03680 [Nitrosomonas sp.]